MFQRVDIIVDCARNFAPLSMPWNFMNPDTTKNNFIDTKKIGDSYYPIVKGVIYDYYKLFLP